jgi:hypothetical protein
MAQQLSTNTFGCAQFIVSADPTLGTHTNITAALNDAVSGDTIFILPGTYGEDLSMEDGVNLTAFTCDAYTPNVVIQGQIEYGGAGTVTLSGIQIQPSGSAGILLDGTAAETLNFVNCYIIVGTSRGMSFSNTDASSVLNFISCTFDTTPTVGIDQPFYSSSCPGTINFTDCTIMNTAGLGSAGVNTAGTVNINYCTSNVAFTVNGTGVLNTNFSEIDTSALDVIPLSSTTGGAPGITSCLLNGGAAAALSVGSGSIAVCYDATMYSTNNPVIDGTGTLDYGILSCPGGTLTINSGMTLSGGTIQGGLNQTPSSGYLGEQIRSSASSVSLSNGLAANITSISLTAGVWDISGVTQITNTGANLADIRLGISTNTASFTGTVPGDSSVQIEPALATILSATIPSFRVVLTSTTTYYLVGQAIFTLGTTTAAGRISATRVG